MKSMVIECPSCAGTGLYRGFMEAKDEAVVCVTCRGSGATTITGREYTGRKRKNGVKKIRFGSGMILDNPSKSKWMTYEEFKNSISEHEVFP